MALLFVALFIWNFKADAKHSNLIINEVLLDGEKGSEFVEIYNNGSGEINMDGWFFNYYSAGRDWNKPYRSKPFPGVIIKPEEYYLIGFEGFGEGKSDWQPYSTAQLNNSDGSLALFDSNVFSSDTYVDAVSWGNVSYVKENKETAVPLKGKSLGRLDMIDTDDNSKDFMELEITPGKKNLFKEDEGNETENAKIENSSENKEAISDYAGRILINEFLPTPPNGSDEFIELYNASGKQEDIFGWVLHDATKSGKYIIKEHVILDPQQYLVILGEIFKFALNSSKETLTLEDIEGKIVSQIYYDKAKSGASYNFNGSSWRWSKFLTPGKENIFNNEPYGKINLPKDVWENVYADFSVSTGDKDGEKVKVIWDFGDGRKSYKEKTKHKYEKKGVYKASVKYSDESEDVIKEFEIKVEKFPEPKVKIIEVNSNPMGSDTKNETITIENKSKKKINLLGWSIATGWKKFINHTIREDFVIEKGKTKILTREISSFTLNNKKDKIELRYPNGEVASKLKYKKEEGIEESEVYQKNKDRWKWVKKISNDKLKITNESIEMPIAESLEIKNEPSVTSGQLSENNNKEIEKELDIEFLKNHSAFEMLNEAKSFKDANLREENGKYFLTLKTPEQEHYAIAFAKEISSELNEKINVFLNDLMN